MAFSEDFKKGFVVGNAVASMGNTYVINVGGGGESGGGGGGESGGGSGDLDLFYYNKNGELGKSHLDMINFSNTLEFNDKYILYCDLKYIRYIELNTKISMTKAGIGAVVAK